MEIQAADLRSPFERAYTLLRANSESKEKIEEDLSALVVELARKFFGINSEVFLEAALHAAVSIINEGLFKASAGRVADEEWAHALECKGVRKIVGEVTNEIKAYAEQKHRLETRSSVPQLASDALQIFFNVSSTKGWRHANAWLKSEMHSVQEQTASLDLLDWLQKNTKVGRLHKQRERGSLEFSLPDQDIENIVALTCGIPAKYLDGYAEASSDIDSQPESPEPVDLYHDMVLPPRLFKESRLLYDSLVEKIPSNLSKVLLYQGKDWFERRVSLAAPAKKQKISKG